MDGQPPQEPRDPHDPLAPRDPHLPPAFRDMGVPPPDEMPRDWRGGAIPPLPPEFVPGRSAGGSNILKGLGIACLSLIAGIAGLFGACFAIMSSGDRSMYPYTFGSIFVFAAAATAMFFLLRPQR